MMEAQTTAAVQAYLDDLAGVGGNTPAEPIVRALLGRSLARLRFLCSSMLYRSYPRLSKPPLNLQSDEMLSAVVERLLKAMRQVRPSSVRQFFALANEHMRWELNDLARRLDTWIPTLSSPEAVVAESSASGISPNARRMLEAIEHLPEEEREVFNLVRIQGMQQTEAAQVLGVSPKTIQRRINRGVLILTQQLQDLQPRQQKET